MTIIDSSYFKKGIHFIPNNRDINALPEGTPSSESDIDFFIEKYEPILMSDALSKELYSELVADLDKRPFNAESTEDAAQKWIDLVNGNTYQLNGKTFVWSGLRNDLKDSLIASFVFSKYLENDELLYTTTGVVRVDDKGADNYNPTPKYIKCWNQFINKYQGNYSKHAPRVMVNGFGSVGIDYTGIKENKEVTLLNYIKHQNELDAGSFPDANLFYYDDDKNSMGI